MEQLRRDSGPNAHIEQGLPRGHVLVAQPKQGFSQVAAKFFDLFVIIQCVFSMVASH